MIKIMSVEIDGFITPTQKVKLDFIESNIICIYGDNGSGKTTFLEILFAVFDRDEEILERYCVNKIKIGYLYDNISKELEIYYDKENIEKDNKIPEKKHDSNLYNFKDLEDSDFNHISSLFLGIGRGIHKNRLDIPKDMIWHFFRINRNISEDKKLTGNEIDDLTDKLVEHIMPKEKDSAIDIESYRAKRLDDKKNIYLPTIDIDTVEAFLKSKYKEAVLDAKEKIEKSLSKNSLNFLQNISPVRTIDLKILEDKLIYNKPLLLEMFSSDENIGIETLLNNLEQDKNFLETIGVYQHIILSNIVEELQSEVELFNEIEIFLNEYNSFLNYNKKLIIDNNGVSISSFDEKHSLTKLSSGERHLLTFFATILLMGEEQDFILLDEPEISLNVDWQRKILSTIAKLAPNSQIIVATHSPLIGRSYRKSVVGLEPKVIDDEK